jgi:hypothetical protein
VGGDVALRPPEAAARRPYLVVLAIARKQAIISARCRESSSIFRASGFYDDSDFLNRCGKRLRHHCFVG